MGLPLMNLTKVSINATKNFHPLVSLRPEIVDNSALYHALNSGLSGVQFA